MNSNFISLFSPKTLIKDLISGVIVFLVWLWLKLSHRLRRVLLDLPRRHRAEGGRPLLGIIDAPCLDERYVGCGGRAWSLSAGIEQPLEVSRCADLAAARQPAAGRHLLLPPGGAARLRL